MSDIPPPIPAATLVLMRPVADGGPPELLMMERPATMAFAAGALVFPGGRIEEQDHAVAAGLAGGFADGAARIAAIRETIEETGIAVGLSPSPSQETLETVRAGLLGGGDFASLLADSGLTLDPGVLVPFARWCPNFRETRRFDASFFVAAVPADTPDPTPQAGEVTRALWGSAVTILQDGDAHTIFPTRRNLERLARFASFEEAREDAERHTVRTITPWVEQRDGEQWICIPADLGYPVTAERLETAKRR